MPRTIQLPIHSSNRIVSGTSSGGGSGSASGSGSNGSGVASPLHVCVRVNRRLVLAIVLTLILVLGLSRATPLPGAPGTVLDSHKTSTSSSNLHGGDDSSDRVGSDNNLKHDQVRHQQPSTTMARAVMATGGQPSLTEYLDSHFPLNDDGNAAHHVWLTLSDGHWMTTGTHALHTFAQQLNKERTAAYASSSTSTRGGKDNHVKDTAVVALCIDEQCVRNAEDRGMYAYGGYQFTRPEKILASTWPKLAALIETTKHRDIFFVDSDVSFRYDPYPHMEPHMKTHDIVAQENDAFDHFNTGWIWMRKNDVTSDAWDKVLKMDLETVSRDQNNFNTVLGTTELRHCDPKDCERRGSQYPLKNDFVAKNGLKVKVLDPRLFRSYHFEADLPSAQRHDSVSLHMTCGDDAFVKAYVAKAQGFWSNVRGYYDDPPMLLTLDHMIGSRSELTQMVKLALMAAHYTNRAFLPTTHASFTDLPKLDSNHQATTASRRSYSAFPFSHAQQFLDVNVVEPLYDVHSSRYLFGASVLGPGKVRKDEGWSEKNERERVRIGLSLHDAAELDMRQVDSFATLYETLSSESFRHHRVVKLVNFDIDPSSSTSSSSSRQWSTFSTSKRLQGFETCHQIQDRPSCDSICRFPDKEDKTIKVVQGWDTLEKVLSDSKEQAEKVRKAARTRKQKEEEVQKMRMTKEMDDDEDVNDGKERQFDLEEDDFDEEDNTNEAFVVHQGGGRARFEKPKMGGIADRMVQKGLEGVKEGKQDFVVKDSRAARVKPRPKAQNGGVDEDDREAQFHARDLVG
ncbi:hypothetical protein ACM66B_006508 [Microbotryomycetes sp. NB124-2]